MVLESSTDLEHWVPLQLHQAEPVDHVDLPATNALQFFRLRPWQKISQ
jgi:hypothetical protein